MRILKNLRLMLSNNGIKLLIRPSYTFALFTFVYYFLFKKTTKDIPLNFGKVKLIVPNSRQVFGILVEIFINDLYSDIRGCDHVLDLGGYIGESGVCLSTQNKNVTIYEASPLNYKYVEKNAKSYNNIKTYNLAVTGDKDQKKLKLSLSDDHDVCGTFTEQGYGHKTVDIECKYIADICTKNNHYDGIKMDIEGAEYDVLDYLLSHGLFDFKVGIIEFHFFDQSYRERFEKIYQQIKSLGYTIKTIDNFKKEKKDLSQMEDINVYFVK